MKSIPILSEFAKKFSIMMILRFINFKVVNFFYMTFLIQANRNLIINTTCLILLVIAMDYLKYLKIYESKNKIKI